MGLLLRFGSSSDETDTKGILQHAWRATAAIIEITHQLPIDRHRLSGDSRSARHSSNSILLESLMAAVGANRLTTCWLSNPPGLPPPKLALRAWQHRSTRKALAHM